MSSGHVHLSALSFEARASASIVEWAKHHGGGRVVLVDYQGEATPGREASELRSLVEEEVQSAAGSSLLVEKMHLSPRSLREMAELLVHTLDNAVELTIDITCLTRPHVLAIAKVLADSHHDNWTVTYTLPGAYGSVRENLPTYGWKGTLLLPLGEDTSMDNQGVSLGLMLLGLDAGRISVAFDDYETDAGIVVATETRDRPDFHRSALRQTKSFMRYLDSLNLTGSRGKALLTALGAQGWSPARIRMERVPADTYEIVDKLVVAAMSIQSADSKPAPIFLYPFGPKLAVFGATFWLCSEHADYSWAVYPIANTHQTDYSSGTGEVLSVHVSQFREVLL